MSQLLTGDDNCVGNKSSNIEAEPIRQGGRLPEWLIVIHINFFHNNFAHTQGYNNSNYTDVCVP